jgi:hypothetical protein
MTFVKKDKPWNVGISKKDEADHILFSGLLSNLDGMTDEMYDYGKIILEWKYFSVENFYANDEYTKFRYKYQ